MRLERIKQQDLLNIVLSIFTVFTYILLITRVSLLNLFLFLSISTLLYDAFFSYFKENLC
jgi:hypothetical protein